MCGLVGVIGRPTYKAKSVFKDLLQMDVIRGPHSTGVAAFGNKRTFVLKNTHLPQIILSSPKWKTNVENDYSDFHVLMGHNRLATQGKITKRNAHPFHHGDITLMHNGTLTKDFACDGKNFETDSEGIAYTINKLGIEETWKELRGAAALVWWDRKDKTVNLITNGQRPLSLAWSIDQEQIIWASEKWMIEAAAERNKFNIEAVVSPKPHWLFQFAYNEQKKKVEAISSELEPFFTTTHHGGRTTFPSRTYRSNMQTPQTNHARVDKSDDIHRHNPDNLPGLYPALGDAIARSLARNPEYSVDKGHSRLDQKGPINLANSNSTSASSIEEVRYLSMDSHKYDPVKNEFVPKEKTDIEKLGDKINAAKNKHKHQGGTLRLPADKEIGKPSLADDLKEARKKKMTEAEFTDMYKECMSCDESLDGDYEQSIVISEKEAICSTCVTALLSSGFSLHDIEKSKR